MSSLVFIGSCRKEPGVAALWIAKPEEGGLITFLYAEQGGGYVRITPFFSVDDDSKLFTTVPQYQQWLKDDFIHEIPASKCGPSDRKTLRVNTVADLLDEIASSATLLAVASNQKARGEGIPFQGYRRWWDWEAAREEEHRLQMEGKIRFAVNPAFHRLVADDAGGVARAYRAVVALAREHKMFELTREQREAAYMRSVLHGTGAKAIFDQKEWE